MMDKIVLMALKPSAPASSAAIADAVIDGRQMSRENAGENVVASHDVGDVEIYRKGGEAS